MASSFFWITLIILGLFALGLGFGAGLSPDVGVVGLVNIGSHVTSSQIHAPTSTTNLSSNNLPAVVLLFVFGLIVLPCLLLSMLIRRGG